LRLCTQPGPHRLPCSRTAHQTRSPPPSCKRFLAEGAAQGRRLIESLGSGFDIEGARVILRCWTGLGNTLGQQQISRLAQQAGNLLEGPQPHTSPQLREILHQLLRLFTKRGQRRRETVLLPDAVV